MTRARRAGEFMLLRPNLMSGMQSGIAKLAGLLHNTVAKIKMRAAEDAASGEDCRARHKIVEAAAQRGAGNLRPERCGHCMSIPMDLLLNAIVAGLLLGGFYAAVTVGVSIAFGMLDVVNIAHPAFIILGSYIAYIMNATFGIDPILAAIIVLPAFYLFGQGVYQVYYLVVRAARRGSIARPCLLLRPAVHHRGLAHSRVRRRLPLRAGRLHRPHLAHRLRGFSVAHAGAVRGLDPARRGIAAVPVAHVRGPRDHGRRPGPAGPAAAVGRSHPHEAHRVRPGRSRPLRSPAHSSSSSSRSSRP